MLAERTKDRLAGCSPTEERQARLEKTASLRRLRSYASWLMFDPEAQFQEEVDCSALLEERWYC